jgi:hypothetical protein
MITLALGFIYGTGFALTLVGGTLWMMFLNAIKTPMHPLLVLGAAILWPITLGRVVYKIWLFLREDIK